MKNFDLQYHIAYWRNILLIHARFLSDYYSIKIKGFLFFNYLALGLFILLYSTQSKALQFNTNEVIRHHKGKGEKLSSNEGYLYLAVNSKVNFEYITILPVISDKQIRFNNIPIGENRALIKLKAGTYYWSRVKKYTLGGHYFYDFDKSKFPIKVEAGKINYPGNWDLNLTSSDGNTGSLFLSSFNKYTSEYKVFKSQYKSIAKSYEFKYQGNIPDNYLQHYSRLLKYNNDYWSEKSAVKAIEEYDISDGIEKETKKFPHIKKYFKDRNQSIGKLNPRGNLLLYSIIDGDYTLINVLNLTTFESLVIYKEKIPKFSYIEDMEWIDSDSVYYRIKLQKVALNMVAHLGFNKDSSISSVNHLIIPSYGRLIDPLSQQGNFIYFGNNSNFYIKKRGLYKIDTSTEKTIKKTIKKHYSKVKKLKGSVFWLTDKNSEVRFVATIDPFRYSSGFYLNYWYLPDVTNKKWIKIKTHRMNDDFIIPQRLSADGKSFYVITDDFGDRKSIHKYSTSDFSHQGVFYENKDFDVESVLTDPSTDEIIGVQYIENGFFKFEYFQTNKDLLSTIRTKNPHLQLFSVNHNAFSNRVLLMGINEYTKGSWYLYNTNNEKTLKLFDEDSDYNKLEKGYFHSLKIKSEDNLNIEGYLVMPESSKKSAAPLIVIPHGGPIGVRDYAYETDLQHFYASQGFATLKINYRGSAGYGKKFKQSGNLQWGEKIEIDINTMVDHVLNKYNIDANKICSMGSSYGGYSAIMLTILHPDRYKCAVSFAGVTDIPLMFTSSDFKDNEEVLKSFTEKVGDPETNLQNLINKSPLYLTDKISRPILMFHGKSDQRVTLEHSLRMKEILDLVHLPSELVILNNEGHSLNNKESEIIYIARSLLFIQKQLLDVKN